MKYMKPKLNTVLILAITSIAANQISAHAESGGRDGHGGGVNVCGQTAELYDFFEGKRYQQLTIPANSGQSVQEYENQAFEKLIASYSAYDQTLVRSEIIKYQNLFRKMFTYTTDILPSTLDADKFEIPAGCSFAQVAIWNERYQQLKVSETIYGNPAQTGSIGLMDNLNQAGLNVHEILYKIARVHAKAIDSDAIRMLVAELFSTKPVINHLALGVHEMVPEIASCTPGSLTMVAANQFVLCTSRDGNLKGQGLFDAYFRIKNLGYQSKNIEDIISELENDNLSFFRKLILKHKLEKFRSLRSANLGFTYSINTAVGKSSSMIHEGDSETAVLLYKHASADELSVIDNTFDGRSAFGPVTVELSISPAGHPELTSQSVQYEIAPRSRNISINQSIKVQILEAK